MSARKNSRMRVLAELRICAKGSSCLTVGSFGACIVSKSNSELWVLGFSGADVGVSGEAEVIGAGAALACSNSADTLSAAEGSLFAALALGCDGRFSAAAAGWAWAAKPSSIVFTGGIGVVSGAKRARRTLSSVSQVTATA